MASSDLLAQIQAGKRLKKAVTVDKSAPLIEAPKNSVSRAPGPAGGGGGPVPGSGGAPQLGGLFAGGMPKLKPAGKFNIEPESLVFS